MLLKPEYHVLGSYDLTGGTAINISIKMLLPSFSVHSYSKTENLDSSKLQTFTFLLVAAANYKHHQNTHKVIAKIQGYSRLKFNWKHWDMIRLIVVDKIYVLQQRIVSCAY